LYPDRHDDLNFCVFDLHGGPQIGTYPAPDVAANWRKTGPIAARRPKLFGRQIDNIEATQWVSAWSDNPKIENRLSLSGRADRALLPAFTETPHVEIKH
jgi:hypothetical protein